MTPSILVGVDASEENIAALEWAADEAVRRGCELRLLHAEELTAMAPVFLGYSSVLDEAARQRLTEAERRVAKRAPGLRMKSAFVDGNAAESLIRASAEAELVVVGLRGRGGFPGLKIGSTAHHVAAHADAPVVVVGPEHTVPTDPAEVVVGIDGSPHGQAAMRAAFAEAERRGARVHAVHATHFPDGLRARDTEGFDREHLRTEQERWAEGLLSEARAAHPDVDAVTIVEWDDPIHSLARASVTALLAVVGARGRRGFPRLALGSVAHGLLHHARSPVMIVHASKAEEDEKA